MRACSSSPCRGQQKAAIERLRAEGPQLAIELLRQRAAIELLSGPGAIERSWMATAPVAVGLVVLWEEDKDEAIAHFNQFFFEYVYSFAFGIRGVYQTDMNSYS